MSRSRFAALKEAQPGPVASPSTIPAPAGKARDGKKAVVGYFSPNVSRELHQLALDTGTSIQALLGEAIDELMRKHGKHPFGEH